jgi:ParB-like chromosome segregation protein Spo0J
MKIEKLPTEKLIPYARNAKKHDAAQVSKLAGSIREFGFNNPILIDKDNGIIAGHGRVMAAQQLGLAEVPCIRLGHLTDNQRKAYILADNRLAEIGGGWDEEMLKVELDALNESGVDLSMLGFDASDVEGLGKGDDAYTRKIESPKYEPKKSKPQLEELIDDSKSKKLIEEIGKSKISEDEKRFLIAAAHRHTVFHFENIAEYYSHSDKSMQELMEDSALVIIDFDKAIERGFVVFSDHIAEMFKRDNPEDEE